MMISYIRKYGPINGPWVMSSKNRVARAGRTGDQWMIEAAREAHYRFMASL